MKKILIGALLLASSAFGVSASVPVEVRKNTEFMSTVARTAGATEYNNDTYKDYVGYIDSVVAPHKNHPAVELFNRIRNRHGFSYDAVASFGLALTTDGNQVRFNPAMNHTEMLDRITPEEADSLVAMLDDFYRVIDFDAIFTSWQPLYDKAIVAFNSMQANVDYPWLEKYYGTDFSGLSAGLSMLNHGNYGLTEKYIEGEPKSFMLIGVHNRNGEPNYDGNESLLIHEGSHPISNPLVRSILPQLNSNSDSIASIFATELRQQAYGGARTVLYETMVRTAEARYALDHAQNEQDSLKAIIAMRGNKLSGFLFIEDFVKALDRYEANRDIYPTLADFMPELAKVHNSLDVDSVYKEVVSKQPQFTGCNIEDNAVLKPGTTSITITFDRPVPVGHGIGPMPGREFPTSPDRKISWNPERTEFTYTVTLAPSKEYGMVFRGQWFKTLEGYPTRGVYLLPFSTSAE